MIDAHLHIWETELLAAPWLTDERARPLRRSFTIADAVEMLRAEGISSAIAVTADESESGTALLLARAAAHPQIVAVVGWSDLTAPEPGARLDALRGGDGGEALRGVRHVAFEAATLDSDALDPGLRALADRRMVLEVLTDEDGLGAVERLCAAAPDLDVVVDHLGNPVTGGHAWQDAVVRLSQHPRAHLKVSGAVVDSPRLPELLRTVRTHLGANRLLAGTDWPVHTLVPGAGPWPVLHEATREWDAEERTELFGATAARLYGTAA